MIEGPLIDRLVAWAVPSEALRWRCLDRYRPTLPPGFAWFVSEELRPTTAAERRERPGLMFTPTGYVEYRIGRFPLGPPPR